MFCLVKIEDCEFVEAEVGNVRVFEDGGVVVALF